jgi:alkylated DNA nucleotide flippase Atl1
MSGAPVLAAGVDVGFVYVYREVAILIGLGR